MCVTPCGLQAPSLQICLFPNQCQMDILPFLFSQLGRRERRERGRKSLCSMRAFHFCVLQQRHAGFPVAHKRRRLWQLPTLSCLPVSGWWGRGGRSLLIKRYLFWSWGKLDSLYTRPFFSKHLDHKKATNVWEESLFSKIELLFLKNYCINCCGRKQQKCE